MDVPVWAVVSGSGVVTVVLLTVIFDGPQISAISVPPPSTPDTEWPLSGTTGVLG